MAEKSYKDNVVDATRSIKDFHDALASTVWSILEDNDALDSGGTGFCVHPRGYILTCNHVVGTDTALCYNFASEEGLVASKGFVHAKVVSRSPSWDIALLQLQDQTKKFDYVRMADELDRVFCGQDIFSIAQNGALPRCFMMGRVIRPFPDYNLNNLASMSSDRGDGSSESKPCVPKILLGRLCSTGCSSGSPIFNRKGAVVGMVDVGIHNQTTAIHYYALNHFISIVHDKSLGFEPLSL